MHVPAGAIPKDGPSAGVTMVAALASLLTGRPVKSTVGMTGEVTLQGRVLPIGGLKQKVLAAHAAGLTEVILPERNEPDLDDVPSDVREHMQFHPVKSVDEVLALALEPNVLANPPQRARFHSGTGTPRGEVLRRGQRDRQCGGLRSCHQSSSSTRRMPADRTSAPFPNGVTTRGSKRCASMPSVRRSQ